MNILVYLDFMNTFIVKQKLRFCRTSRFNFSKCKFSKISQGKIGGVVHFCSSNTLTCSQGEFLGRKEKTRHPEAKRKYLRPRRLDEHKVNLRTFLVVIFLQSFRTFNCFKAYFCLVSLIRFLEWISLIQVAS